jgi:hypothetical protein
MDRKAEVRRTAITLHTTAAVTSLAVLAPVLAPGYVLSYDMVFTPRSPLGDDAVGLGSDLPRAVPQDALVALVTQAVPGEVLQKLVLVAAIYLAVLGAARLVPSDRGLTAVVAGVGYAWTAYVAERLVLGHWGLLLAYAALPWLVRAALAARRGDPVGAVVGWAALAAVTPTGGLLAAFTAAVLLLWRGGLAGRRRWWALAGLAALNAPWLVAGLLAGAAARSDADAVQVFAARGENWSGVLGAVLGTGGVWNRQVVPASRETWLTPVLTGLLLAGAVYGIGRLRRRWPAGDTAAVVAVALAGVALALLGAVPGGRQVLRWLVEIVPGTGLLRDGHKFLAPFALLVAVGFALGAERLADRVRGTGPVPAAAVLVAAVLFPVLTLPDLAWGGLGRLDPVRYPPDWDRVAAELRGEGGELVTLPYTAFRAYRWNGGRTSLDPADRYLPVPVVVDDALAVRRPGGGVSVIGGESRRAAEVRRCLDEDCRLATIGVRWVLVETDQPGAVPEQATGGMRQVYAGDTLALYEASTTSGGPAGRPGWHRLLLIVAYAAAAGSLFMNGVVFALRRRRTDW